MKKHIFKTFLDDNFKTSKKISLKNITLFYGFAGSGKTYLLNNLLTEENHQLLYIGRNYEKYQFFQELSSVSINKLNKKRMFLGSEDEKVDYNKLEKSINRLITFGYLIVFDEVFWEDGEEYYKMIERIIINNKLDQNLKIILTMQHISDKEYFSFERIAKNLSQVLLFKNDIIEDEKLTGEFSIYKREKRKTLTKKQIESFHKN